MTVTIDLSSKFIKLVGFELIGTLLQRVQTRILNVGKCPALKGARAVIILIEK